MISQPSFHPLEEERVELGTPCLCMWKKLQNRVSKFIHELTQSHGKLYGGIVCTSDHDGELYEQWLCKLSLAKHAELQWWSEHDELLQFELHLSDRAERSAN